VAEVPEKQCDLVMKGGITSGVVYPRAISRIAKDYRLLNIGGTSAGAIAAVVAAACEYRRQGDPTRGVEPTPTAFDQFETVTKEITQPGFIPGLFQATPAGKPVLDLGLALVKSTGSTARRILTVGGFVLRRSWWLAVLAAVLVASWLALVSFGAWAIVDAGVSWKGWIALVLGVLLLVPVTIALVVPFLLGALVRFVLAANEALMDNFLGLVAGHNPDPGGPPALTDWLHETTQKSAGLGLDEPLTFSMLKGADPEHPVVNLRFITTDLSYSRPVDLPANREGWTSYFFDPGEMARFFPASIVEAMKHGSEPRQYGSRTLHPFPADDLPIVVAARLSLSFPILLSAIPLWSEHPTREGELVEHCMSDGGISSNFPIHFFDALFPGRPTFGLDLQPYPDPKEQEARDLKKEPYVLFGAPRQPGFSSVNNLFTFFRQLLDAARNWRDSLQGELPGYRDRICQIRLTKTEGGLNLDMDPKVVAVLVERGEEAGDAVCTEFDWVSHRFTRFLTLVEMLNEQLGADAAQKKFAEFRSEAGEDIPLEDWETYAGHEPDWWPRTSTVVAEALNYVTWPADAKTPLPKPTMRIVPKV
jgi:Patatin-like phospholipase